MSRKYDVKIKDLQRPPKIVSNKITDYKLLKELREDRKRLKKQKLIK
jgi:hypothetical protein